jgi:hypothetical protein
MKLNSRMASLPGGRWAGTRRLIIARLLSQRGFPVLTFELKNILQETPLLHKPEKHKGFTFYIFEV